MAHLKICHDNLITNVCIASKLEVICYQRLAINICNIIISVHH